MAERQVIICGKIFFYRQKAPFVPSGKSVLGALEYDPEEDKVRCHECGKWFSHVGSHCALKHGMSARNYKFRHGLRQHSALVGERVRLKCKERGEKRKRLHGMPILRGYPGGRHCRGSCGEMKNERGNCAAQVLFKLQSLAKRLGRTPTDQELRANGLSTGSIARKLNVSNMAAVWSLCGLVPNPCARRKYSVPLLTELLLDFYVAQQRLPSISDYHRGLLPARVTFQRYFGSMGAAYKAAGLEKVRRG